MNEPLSALAEAAVSAHELFIACMQGGFTEDQALTLVAKMLAESA